MTTLRNIGYLRFGSKILRGYAGFFYLPHPPSPLSGSRGQKMRTQGEEAEFYISGGSLPPPCRAAGPLPPTSGAAGSLQGPLRKKKLFTYRSLPPRAVGPLPGGRGIEL